MNNFTVTKHAGSSIKDEEKRKERVKKCTKNIEIQSKKLVFFKEKLMEELNKLSIPFSTNLFEDLKKYNGQLDNEYCLHWILSKMRNICLSFDEQKSNEEEITNGK